MIRQRIQNKTVIDLDGSVDLTTSSDVTVWVKQGSLELKYTNPTVVTATQMTLTIPFADAMKLDATVHCTIQAAGLDSNYVPWSTDPVIVDVGEFIAEEGYNPDVS